MSTSNSAVARSTPPTYISLPTPTASPAPTASTATSNPRTAATDPIFRNALRYTISAREYALLHKYVIARSRVLRRRAPAVDVIRGIMDGKDVGEGGGKGRRRPQSLVKGEGKVPAPGGEGADGYNARAIRHSIRVFVATGALMKIWGAVGGRLTGRKANPASKGQKKQPLHKSSTLRLSLSLSTILLMYRLLFRFFTRLRAHLLDPSATPFRKRNPRTTNTLTSPYAPALRYTLFRALEFGWNCAEENGMVWGWEKGTSGRPDKKRARPWWWGSWMLQPFAFGQLLHAVVFDRDCFPANYGDFIFKHSTTYLHPKPADFPLSIAWPKTNQIVDSLAQMARLNWPAFVSPVLFPNKEDILPSSLTAIAPITSGAHPLITALSCATLHPSDPSCSRTFLTFWLRSFPPMTRFLLLIYSAMLLPRFRALYHFPLSTLHKLVSQALRMSAFVTGSIATAWSSICFFQTWFPRTFLPTQRFFLGGFLAGFWALVERRRGRGVFLYSTKVSVDSLWKVGVKRRWWRAMKGGDVWVFVLALMLTGVVYERDARAVKEGSWRKGISWVRGEGWKDWGAEEDEEEGDGEGRRED
ncbi:hypothetical protein B0T25DRAFT_610498 [Lasiosphaeria hispida]|uniref:Uncharacterized protein n=1 Tax=Lasiosphaeria hispida TaxID=260671 RepID=A0AAJ0HEX9_9PEZI|nr:hypothetical protein B0T25DRAFT_610498 [Lasiosphaeria hispida]